MKLIMQDKQSTWPLVPKAPQKQSWAGLCAKNKRTSAQEARCVMVPQLCVKAEDSEYQKLIFDLASLCHT